MILLVSGWMPGCGRWWIRLGWVGVDGWVAVVVVGAGGVSHNAWAGNESLRVMQPASNEDFELEVKFESAPTANYQSDGVLVEASPGNYVRFDLYSASGSLWAFASTTVNGTSSVRANTSTGPVGVSPSWLRVSRVGNVWKGSYSFDGVTFTQYASFSHSMTVSSVGPFSGNAGSPVPAHTTVVDYFFNTASPIVPEDGTAPDFHTVSTSVTGSGSVVSDPAGGTYPAGTEVSLTAVPDAGWSFTGWSGALSGSQNPATVTVDADLSVSATFELIPDTTPPLISGVGVAASSTSATVTWSTNEPATGAVAYGLTASHELGTTPTSTTGVNHSVTLTNLNPDTTYHYTITATDPSGNTTTTTNTTFTTPAAPAGPAGVFVSDDFAGVGLDAGLWSVVDPVGDGSVSTDGSRLLLSVPAGVSHNAWAGNESLRVMQPASNEDFELEVKFESAPTANYQSDGVLVEASPGNYVRFDLYSASGSLWAFASTTVNGTSSVRTNTSTGPSGVSVVVAGVAGRERVEGFVLVRRGDVHPVRVVLALDDGVVGGTVLG
jgi:regulation of enolase protein 1 (concanavalin A-like superfamily)